LLPPTQVTLNDRSYNLFSSLAPLYLSRLRPNHSRALQISSSQQCPALEDNSRLPRSSRSFTREREASFPFLFGLVAYFFRPRSLLERSSDGDDIFWTSDTEFSIIAEEKRLIKALAPLFDVKKAASFKHQVGSPFTSLGAARCSFLLVFLFPVERIWFRAGVRHLVPFLFWPLGADRCYFDSKNDRTDRRCTDQKSSRHSTYRHRDKSGAFCRGDDGRLHEIVLRQRVRPKKTRSGSNSPTSSRSDLPSLTSSPTSSGSAPSSPSSAEFRSASFGGYTGSIRPNFKVPMMNVNPFLNAAQLHAPECQIDANKSPPSSSAFRSQCEPGSYLDYSQRTLNDAPMSLERMKMDPALNTVELPIYDWQVDAYNYIDQYVQAYDAFHPPPPKEFVLDTFLMDVASLPRGY
jgi:hypothetical protein